MLNYADLSDNEFEKLCMNIVNRKFKLNVRGFAKGRDRGIDLADSLTNINNLVQVKHYIGSTVAQLINQMKKEKSKVDALKPKNYYICTSLSLSPDKVKEVYLMFSDYMQSENNILTILEIDDFLNDPQNADILNKNYKLWIDRSGILNEVLNNKIFVDCEVLLSGIDRLKKFFVATNIYYECLNCLQDNGAILITGNPGVGKTITSKMLALHFAALGYCVRYTTNVTNLTELKSSLSRDSEQKEVIILDDCFGQAYFQMKESQNRELLSLIKYVNLNKNKYIILNSRVTIFNCVLQICLAIIAFI